MAEHILLYIIFTFIWSMHGIFTYVVWNYTGVRIFLLTLSSAGTELVMIIMSLTFYKLEISGFFNHNLLSSSSFQIRINWLTAHEAQLALLFFVSVTLWQLDNKLFYIFFQMNFKITDITQMFLNITFWMILTYILMKFDILYNISYMIMFICQSELVYHQFIVIWSHEFKPLYFWYYSITMFFLSSSIWQCLIVCAMIKHENKLWDVWCFDLL